MYQKLQRLIPKPVFDYFSGKGKIIYQSLNGKVFQLELANKSLPSTTPKSTQVHNREIEPKTVVLNEIDKSKNEELNKIKVEVNEQFFHRSKKFTLKPRNSL